MADGFRARLPQKSVRLSKHQDIKGPGQIAGGRSDDSFRPDVDFAVLAQGGTDVGFAHEIHGGRGPGAGDRGGLRCGERTRLRRGQSAIAAFRNGLLSVAGTGEKESVDHIGGDVRDDSRGRPGMPGPGRGGFRGLGTGTGGL